MMSKITSETKSPSTSTFHLLFLPFVALILVNLKIAGVIDWSWWLVFSPLVFHALGLFFLLFVIGLMAVAAVLLTISAIVRWFDKQLFGRLDTPSPKEEDNG